MNDETFLSTIGQSPQAKQFIVKVELIVQTQNGVVVLQPLRSFALKTPLGYPSLLFELPKAQVVLLIKKDGILNMGIGFKSETILTACADYLER